jgi:hypothetical protein
LDAASVLAIFADTSSGFAPPAKASTVLERRRSTGGFYFYRVRRITSIGPTAWQGERVDEIKMVSHSDQEQAMQTHLADIAQRYPAVFASLSYLSVITFYVVASSAFA